jgi:hypothetical protein|tara:strand:+ start:60 stop:305 length:246 start_codon:yes stop_codon:yes gene_type:complete
MTTTKSTIETLREQGDLAKEVSNLTMYMDGGTTELIQHIGFLGDKIEDQSNATRDYLDDIRSSIDKNTEALVLIGQILRNK